MTTSSSVQLKVHAKHYNVSYIIILCLHNYAEFESWKEETERATDTNFVRSTGLKSTEADLETKTYYYCNRSGYFLSISTGKRSFESQETSKLNTIVLYSWNDSVSNEQ